MEDGLANPFLKTGRIRKSVLRKTPSADGIVEKAIFSITCTTCHARLAVRSEAAIGAVLECPKCASMVLVVPPEGWKATPPVSNHSPASASPPPLDRVNAGLVSLELEPGGASWFGAMANHWRLVTATALAVVVVGWGLWWMLAPSPTRERKYSTEKQEITARPAAKVEHPATDAKRPTAAIVGGSVTTTPPPRPQSRGVSPPIEKAKPTPEITTPSQQPVITKPSKPDPFRRLIEEAGRIAKEEAYPKEIKRLPPARVDVAAKWAVPLHGIELSDMPLMKVLDFFSSLSTVPVTLDADAMGRFGVGPQDKISLQLGETTIGNALQAAAAQRGLTVLVDAGVCIVTSPKEHHETLRKVRYTVSDLAGEDQASVALFAALVERFVAPESWRSSGGQGTIEPERGAMTLVQTDDVHRQMLVFCERLRLARGKPLRSREAPEHFTLVTKLDQARKLLDRPVTATFSEPTPLGGILASIAKSAQCTILIDRAALAAAETSDRVESTLSAVKEPLDGVLAALLRPLGLTYRVIDANLLQVTSKEAAEERLDVEFHPIGPWLKGGVSGIELADVLKSRVAPETWNDIGGLADIFFDPTSRSLIVLQSQPVQAMIERLLADGPSQ